MRKKLNLPVRYKKLTNEYKPALIFPFHNHKMKNIIFDKERNISFKNILAVNELFKNEDYITCMYLLNCETLSELFKVLNVLNLKRWNDSSSSFLENNLTKEEIQSLNEETKMFDYNKDYDAYYCDFWELNIDLETAEIDWFKFNWFINKIVNDEKTLLNSRIRARGYEPNKHDSLKYKTAMLKEKEKYTYQNLNKNLEKISQTIGGVNNGNK